jgi:hypothetical protein
VPNWNKSAILFSKWVNHQVMQDIRQIFHVPDIDTNTIHLGHPLILPAKDRAVAYNFIYGKFKSKLTTYVANKLSHAARLELIKSVFSSIPVYYMSNILFSKKFLNKLTAIIRRFWWTGVKEEDNARSLCLRAWADICTPKQEGGLGIKNLQATNQGLILSAAWRLAKDPETQLALILKSKYHPDTSIWRAKSNVPKSAFWSAILKVKHLLMSASFYQLLEGNISVWSSPWFSGWETIYDNLIIHPQPFAYPAVVKDLWMPNQKTWNVPLINALFTPQTANSIIQTPIIDASGPDLLCWKLTPTGEFSCKSAYRHCFSNLLLPENQRPKEVHLQVKALLMQVWKDKSLAPRVQTFAWRLLRKALPTGKRAGRFSTHIEKDCSRCGQEEDDMHMFFLCPFAKAVWFAAPWHLRSEVIVNTSLLCMIPFRQSFLQVTHMHLFQIFTLFFGAYGKLGTTLSLAGR